MANINIARGPQARHRRQMPVVSPQRVYRDFISQNWSPEVSLALTIQRHGRDWLTFGTGVR